MTRSQAAESIFRTVFLDSLLFITRHCGGISKLVDIRPSCKHRRRECYVLTSLLGLMHIRVRLTSCNMDCNLSSWYVRGGIIEFGGLRNEKAKHFIIMESLERVDR